MQSHTGTGDSITETVALQHTELTPPLSTSPTRPDLVPHLEVGGFHQENMEP